MPWVSYAQNAEDVRLRRAFLKQASGFYVDVGANNPVDDSISKHFYDKGWTGINVEPAPRPFALIQKARQRDVNLNAACSDRPGTMTLLATRGRATALSTFTVEEAAKHEKKGFEFDSIVTPVMTLSSICERHVSDRTIDFLSIDVEGHERSVLLGADFRRFRPRVIVIEATRPMSPEPTHHLWEDLILPHDYQFAVFDGLNRYYVRREDEGLIPALALAPNVFDDFIPYHYKREIDGKMGRLAQRAAEALVRSIGEIARAVGKTARR
ncbi:MAG TPA: FkbM family methyltransferase [Polyangiaceae bacterium]|nr:FkbM family methyltransferase [Polyangiaceae bacterium]